MTFVKYLIQFYNFYILSFNVSKEKLSEISDISSDFLIKRLIWYLLIPASICPSKLTMKALEQGVKYVQS